MNDYTKIEIKVGLSSPRNVESCPAMTLDDFIDILSQRLADEGFESFQVQDDIVTAFIPSKIYNRNNLTKAIDDTSLYGFTAEVVDIENIEGQDWNSEWEKNYFEPYVFGNNKCVVHSSFHKGYPVFEHDIIIDPKMAFGTGHHSTTRLMSEALLTMDLKGLSVADIGTGSAILSILASKLGANPITAVEIDEFAYTNALENIELNHCRNINIILGEVGLIPAQKQFDVLLANINRNIILAQLGQYALRVKSSGCILLSGFYHQDVEMILAEASKHGLTKLFINTDKDWAIVGLTFNE